MAAAGAVVFDASAALEILLPDAAARFAAAVDLVDKICSRKVVAHIPLACFNEFATGCARAVRGRRTSASVQPGEAPSIRSDQHLRRHAKLFIQCPHMLQRQPALSAQDVVDTLT